ncbi:tetratricopeptide repeat protein [Thalassotalea sp. SU-HH00458]|uniref:tetratricopeptide repeat protein n=1 Tax=Thalassotalea sp. SU-HH00458 TaxID=3127657 RepID=UPI0031059074
MSVKKLLLFFLLLQLGIVVKSYAADENLTDIEQNIAKVERLFLIDPELLDNDEVVQLSQDIIQNRTFYDNNTVGKVFSLLADAATNKGDLSRAMQFSLDGESLTNIDVTLRLTLILKITSGYYFRGKFKQAQQMAEESVNLATQLNNPKFLVQALSYRSMTNALNLNHQQAFSDLERVKQYLTQHQEFSDHLAVLNVLASAYFYTGDYQTSVTLYNRILKLRYDLSKVNNIESTYTDLARSYLSLGRLDDAHHGFWKAITLAEKKQAPIKVAYGKMGLGQVLFRQNKAEESLEQLLKAKTLFHGQNLSLPYLTTLIYLAKASQLLKKDDIAFQYLKEAELVADRVELTHEQIELYALLATMYHNKQLFEKAFTAQRKYTELLNKFSFSKQKLFNTMNAEKLESEKRRDLSLGMAEETDLKNQFTQKYQQQKNMIVFLISIVGLLFCLLLFLGFRARALRLNQQYDEVEKPLDYLASPSQTKKFYQQHFKMARKYEYPLMVGYFSIDNWQELEFQFNKRVIAEVSRTISTLVNEYRGEFDQVGLINQGEYLFLCPHQDSQYLKELFGQLTEALKVQFFANLGEFTIKIGYDYQSPSAQDIDPYIFLSRLSESTRAEYSSYKN